MPAEYIHSYADTEQNRLLNQAAFLEPYIHPLLTFEPDDSVLEIGCGVGAQIKTVLKRHRISAVTGIDFSPVQIGKARQLLSAAVPDGKVRLLVGSGACLPFVDESFDAICIFFVLEHIANPGEVLVEARRVLKPGGRIYCTEVFNSGIYIYPHSEILMDYWNRFNQLQAAIGGNPDMGIQLPNVFLDAGFRVEAYVPQHPMLDKRMGNASQREHFFAMWEALFLSGAELLISRGLVTKETTRKVSAEFRRLRDNSDSIFEYGLRQIVAFK